MSWNNIIPWGTLFPQALCKVCGHRFANHGYEEVGCIGPLDQKKIRNLFIWVHVKSIVRSIVKQI